MASLVTSLGELACSPVGNALADMYKPTQSPCEELRSSSPIPHAPLDLYIFKWLPVARVVFSSSLRISYMLYDSKFMFVYGPRNLFQFSTLVLFTGSVTEQYQLVTLQLACFAFYFVLYIYFCFNYAAIMLPLASSSMRASSENAVG